MDVVIDTDVLSTFAKINRLELLERLFSQSKILLTPNVSKEIKKGIQLGIIRSQRIKFSRIKLDLSEKKVVKEIRADRKLGLGDAECIAVAKYRNCLLITNDRQAEIKADSLSVSHINLPLVLRELWKNRIISKQHVVELIKEIEIKDRIVIKNKELILK
ncbi:MAG: PIN domain-containing protein [Thermodesulfobacteriota bacterium]